MAVNKVEYAGMVLLDLTEDSVVEEALLPGYTAHDKSGRKITGILGTDKFVSGTFTQNDPLTMEIDTGLDEIKALVVYAEPPNENTSCTFGFVYTKDNSKLLYHTKKSVYTSAMSNIYDGIKYITVQNGSFSGTRYGSDGSYNFVEGTVFQWVAWGSGKSDSATERDVYVSGTRTVSADSDTLEIETGLDEIKGFIAFNQTSKTDYPINMMVYSEVVQAEAAKTQTVLNYATIGTLFSVEDNGVITISKGESNYKFATDAPYEWMAWGKGTVKIGGSSDNGSTDISLQEKTITPSETLQAVTADNGYDGLSKVTVNAVDSEYIGSGVTKKSAQTYIPGTADQSIASGQYLSGTQTIKGDANLKAANIKKGVSIFNVAGTYESASSGGSTDNNCEAYLIDVTDPSVTFKRTDGTIKAWGYAYTTSSSGWSTTTTVYAFAGDKYYRSAVYGSPTATNLTLDVSGGKLTGLPTLTGGELLITKGV